MDKPAYLGRPIDPAFVARLQMMGFAATGASNVLKSIILRFPDLEHRYEEESWTIPTKEMRHEHDI